MGKWIGVIGIVLIVAGVLLIRIPAKGDGGMSYTGLFVTEEIRKYPVMARVAGNGSEIGVALQDYELDFGILSQGMVARKTMSLESSGVPVKVRLWTEGNISGLIAFSRQEFLLDGPETVEVIMNASMQGSYEGNIFVSSRGARHGWLGGVASWL